MPAVPKTPPDLVRRRSARRRRGDLTQLPAMPRDVQGVVMQVPAREPCGCRRPRFVVYVSFAVWVYECKRCKATFTGHDLLRFTEARG
jgi:hypothetical protein